MKIRGGLDGLESLHKGLARITDPVPLAGAVAEAAEAVRGAAQANLRDGSASGERPGGVGDAVTINHAPDGLSVTVGTTATQGWHREFGSISRPAAPWLAPALDAARPGIIARIRLILTR